jgi:O-antigen/teichoic acid export membrane protein
MVTILIKIGISKFIAIFIGVAGLGFYGVITNTVALIISIADLGVSKSSIRNISEARGSNSEEEVSTTITVVKKLLFYTGLAGGITTLLLSYYISIWSFDNPKYWFSFVLLGIAVFFTILNNGRASILQGMREFKLITFNTAVSAIVGFIFSLPLIYFFKINGIVYALLSTALIGFVVSSFYIKKLQYIKSKNLNAHFKPKSFNIVKLGLSMMLVTFLVSLSAYLIRIFITKNGGLADVGYFQAGFQIISGYFGIIFTSMVTDYFPRLSAINDDNEKVEIEVNQQGVITLLLIGPLVTILPFIMPYLITILYSNQFYLTIDYVNIALFGIIFQSGSQTMGMVLLAKNESKVFIFSVTIFQTIFLVLNILGYKYFGILGLGVTFSLNMLIHFIGVQLLNKKLYNIVFSKQFFKIFFFTLLLAMLAFLSKDLEAIYKWSLFMVLFFCSVFYSINNFKKLLGIKSIIDFIKNKLNAKNKKNIKDS